MPKLIRPSHVCLTCNLDTIVDEFGPTFPIFLSQAQTELPSNKSKTIRTDQFSPQIRTRLFLDAPLPIGSHAIAISELGCGPVYSHRDRVI
jgi:hypothetical protein